MSALPATQYAVQLVGPSQLKLNPAKAVTQPRPHEILLHVEACGLCFSDLKLLKQFSGHARKSEVIGGLPPDVLKGIQSYVPGEKPGVPGHEVVCRIIAVGGQVKHHKVGERCLVQTDYRDLPTASSNAAFGYNFEGGLQEYCIVDERVAIDSKGERFLIPVSEDKSASAIALVEPWACVEDSYVNRERQAVKAGGRLLIVADNVCPEGRLPKLPVEGGGKLGTVRSIAAADANGLPDEGFDDIVYFGADKNTIETLNDKLAPRGLMNVVLGGKKIGAKVNVGVGRVHYGMTRWVGTVGSDAAESYKTIPATTEIRPNDRIIVIGAGGPMGQMHIIRNICSGIPGISQVGTDMDDPRLESLERKAGALAKAHAAPLKLVNTVKQKITEKFSYWALMAPVAALVGEAIGGSFPGAIINVFAGIPAPTKHEIDLDTYIANRLYMFGTSGSVIEDMRIVLHKVESGQLDTNTSMDAVSGMAGATDGIKAIEERTLAGKIIVYPMLHEVPLIPLGELRKRYPTVAALLKDGQWNKEAEAEFLKVAAK
jgi:L-sorbose 1-phosphate reductase